jgi:hypothetical protein
MGATPRVNEPRLIHDALIAFRANGEMKLHFVSSENHGVSRLRHSRMWPTIRAGNVFVDTGGSRDRTLELNATY